jgi:hypothetical protein
MSTSFKNADEHGNIICTAEQPWDRGSRPRAPARVIHPDAKEGKQSDGYPGGDIVDMACPHCGHTWEMELPQ